MLLLLRRVRAPEMTKAPRSMGGASSRETRSGSTVEKLSRRAKGQAFALMQREASGGEPVFETGSSSSSGLTRTDSRNEAARWRSSTNICRIQVPRPSAQTPATARLRRRVRRHGAHAPHRADARHATPLRRGRPRPRLHPVRCPLRRVGVQPGTDLEAGSRLNHPRPRPPFDSARLPAGYAQGERNRRWRASAPPHRTTALSPGTFRATAATRSVAP